MALLEGAGSSPSRQLVLIPSHFIPFAIGQNALPAWHFEDIVNKSLVPYHR